MSGPAFPLRALLQHDAEAFRATQHPGSYRFTGVATLRPALVFCCPCGCGDFSEIALNVQTHRVPAPSWDWDGNVQNPTLNPSVLQLECGWHGWLWAGYWEKIGV